VYYKRNKILFADSESFEVINEYYSKDKSNVYDE
jgi:hypothetical protein